MFLGSYYMEMALLDLMGKKYNKTKVLIKDILIKIILTGFTLLAACTLSYSQINGVNFQDAEEVEIFGVNAPPGAEHVFEKSIIIKDIYAYAFSFPVSSPGLRKCMRAIVELLNDNGLSYLEPVEINEDFPDSIDISDINLDNFDDLNHQLDYDKINNTLVYSETIIYRVWYVDEWKIILNLSIAGYTISIEPKNYEL